MELKDALGLVRQELGKLLTGGQQFVHIPSLVQYLNGLERDAPTITQSTELQHESFLAQHRAEHETNLEMFRSVIEAGKTAVTTSILVCGGGTAALLTFIGTLYSKGPEPHIPGPLIVALIAFASGVLAGAIAAGFRYATQYSYQYRWRRSAVTLHVLSILVVLASYVLFAVGVGAAYHAFIK